MKTATIAMGQSLAYSFAALSVVCIIKIFLTPDIPDPFSNGVAENASVVMIILIAVFAIVDIGCVVNGLLVMSSRYRPLIRVSEDTLGEITPSDQTSSGPVTGFDDMSHRIALAQPRLLKDSAVNLLHVLAMKSTSSNRVAVRVQGVVLLTLAVIAHGFAVCAIGRPAIMRFHECELL